MLDAQLEFSNAQAITATTTSTNIIDFGLGREIAFGTPVPILMVVNEDFNNLTTLKVAVMTADNKEMAGAVELASTVVELDNLKKGAIVPFTYMPAGNKGFVQLQYTVVGTAPTKGKISACIADCIPYGYQNM